MEQQQIILIATITAKKDMEKQLMEDLLKIVALTQQEPGCIQFEIHQDVQNPGVFVLWEHFASQSAYDEHMQMPYTQAYFAKQNAFSTEVVTLKRLNKVVR